MGSLTDDMTRLRGEIGALRESRCGFLGQLQNDVENMQTGFRTDHAEMTRGMNDNLGAFVSDLRTNVSQMTQTFRSDRADIREYVNAMAGEVFDLRKGFRAEHAAMARRLTDELQTVSPALSVDVTRMLEGFFNERAEMAEKTEAGLRAFINGLKKDVSSMRAGFRTDHAEVKKSVSDLRHRVADLRATFAADIENAHHAWAGTSGPGKRDDATVEKARKIATGDLTRISGIGPGNQSRLNAAGLFTLKQLAASTSAALEAAVGKTAKTADVERWIEEAKALV